MNRGYHCRKYHKALLENAEEANVDGEDNDDKVDDTNDNSNRRHQTKRAEPKPMAQKRRQEDSAGNDGSENAPKKTKNTVAKNP